MWKAVQREGRGVSSGAFECMSHVQCTSVWNATVNIVHVRRILYQEAISSSPVHLVWERIAVDSIWPLSHRCEAAALGLVRDDLQKLV